MLTEVETRTKSIDMSVIVPIGDPRQSEPIADLYREYKDQIDKVGLTYEFVFVLEGDQWDTFDILSKLKNEGDPIRILKFSQQFGDATALSAAFEHSRGEFIITLPAYHQVDTDRIPALITALEDADLVAVRRWPRTDSKLKGVQTRGFHFLLRLLLRVNFRDLGCGVRALRRKVIEEVHVYGHKHWFLPILARQLGFRVSEIDMPQRDSKVARMPHKLNIYPRRLLDLVSIFFLVKFTRKPLRFFGITGLFLFAAGALFTAFMAYQRMFEGVALADRPALLLGLLLIVLGIQLFAIGLIGELIIFTHSKDMKEYTIERIVN